VREALEGLGAQTMTTAIEEPPAAAGLPASRTDADGFPILRPTRLTIHRTSKADVRDRQIILSLDGRKIATLMYGQTVTREIPPGPHTLRANNTLVWKTISFEAAPGEDVHFTCVNRAPGSLRYLLFVFGVGPLFVTLEPGTPDRL
jgi:hypothetical protein